MENLKVNHPLDAEGLRRRLKARGMTLGEFANAVGIHQSSLSAILVGRTYLGSRVRARFDVAIARLGLDRDDAPDAAPDAAPEG